MSRRLYKHNRVRYWYAYDLEEICALFDDTGLHIQTVRKWIKNGLKTTDKGTPTLIYGNDLIEFLKKKNHEGKRPTHFNEMYCMKCRDARPVYQNKIKVEHSSQFLKSKAHCRTCKTLMNKSYKLSDLQGLKRTFRMVDDSVLYDCANSAVKTHFPAQEQSDTNESFQRELF